MYRKIGGLTVFVLPKCASTVMLDYSVGAEPQDDATVFVRDPIERCASAWRFFWQYPYMDMRKPWAEWVDRILSGAFDMHWSPQAQLCDDGHRKRPVLFERLGELLPALPHANKTDPRDIDRGYRADELRLYYAADHQLRAQCR